MSSGPTCDLLRHKDATAGMVTPVFADIIMKLVNQGDNYRFNTTSSPCPSENNVNKLGHTR